MPASDQTIELISTKDIIQFLPLMRELADDFGDRFLLSMLHWCGIGKRARIRSCSGKYFYFGTIARFWAYAGSTKCPRPRQA
jgi:hypothetical protein